MKPLPTRLAWGLVLIATATMAVSYLDRQALSVLAPTITTALGLSETTYGALVAAFSVAYLAGAPLAGRLIDAVGARRGLLASVLVWSTVAAAHAVVPGISTLFLLRILLGLAEAPSFPGAAQTVARALPPADRNAGFGVLFTGSSFGAMLAPLIVATFAARWGWRPALAATALVGLAWVPPWLWITRSPEAREALGVRAASPRDPARYLDLVRLPAVRRAVYAVLSASPIIAFALLWSAKVLVGRYQVSQLDVRRYLWLPPLFFDLGSAGFGALQTLRVRARGADVSAAPLVVMAVLLGAGLGAMPLCTTPWGATLMLALASAGGGGVFALATSEMLRQVPASRVAAAAGTTAAAQSIAYVVANPLIGWAADRFHGHGEACVAVALCSLPGGIAWLALGRARPAARAG